MTPIDSIQFMFWSFALHVGTAALHESATLGVIKILVGYPSPSQGVPWIHTECCIMNLCVKITHKKAITIFECGNGQVNPIQYINVGLLTSPGTKILTKS